MKSEKKPAMKGFGFALEQHMIEDIENTMGYLDLARSERYRNLVILGLDEYAISDSKLRKKKFPINGKKLIPFTVMLPDAINKEIESVKKKRNQIKRLAIRYIVLLGFEKFKRDNQHPIKEINLDKKVEPKIEADKKSYKPWQKKLPEEDLKMKSDQGTIDTNNYFENEHTTIPSEFHKNKMAGPDPLEEIKPVSKMNLGEKFQILIELVMELDLKITIEKK